MAKIERSITVEGIEYSVLISDEAEALLAAKAAGRVFVGLPGSYDLYVPYIAESIKAADDAYLEQIVRRYNRLPWIIGKSKRLILREFVYEDFEEISQAAKSYGKEMADEEAAFSDRDQFCAYIKNQYALYQYGIWAMVRNTDKKVVGYSGIYNGRVGLELGYRTFPSWQGQGYAFEACEMVLKFVKKEYDCPLYARVKEDNLPSINLLGKLGFEKYSESAPGHMVYAVNLK